MNIKKHIPNAITCCNLLCGCLAIEQSFNGNLVMAAYLVGLAGVFDFFDGFVARLLKVSSPIGKDLDSLADMITFGVVPGFVMYQMVKRSLVLDKEGFELFNSTPLLVFFPFIIIVFSAIRLAKFNNDTRQTDSFIGVPTPANAILICSIPLIVNWNSEFSYAAYSNYSVVLNPYFLCVSSFVLSLLLVSEIPLIALKFKHFKWIGNEIRFMFIGTSILLLVLLQFIGIPLVMINYILLSVVNNIMLKKKVIF